VPKLPVASAALLLVLVAGTAPVMAQGAAKDDPPMEEKAVAAEAPQGDEAEKVSESELLADYLHYIFIEQIPLATSMGQALVDRNVNPAAFVKLVDSSSGYARFTTANTRALRHKTLEPVAAQLAALYEAGKRATVRSPAAVTENIKLLTGNQQARSLGADRLQAAREYAMPQLLAALMQHQDTRLRAEVRQVMVEMGRNAVMPLCAALPQLDPSSQQSVADILGDIGYKSALPYLYQLRAAATVPGVKQASEEAIQRISQTVNESVPVAHRFVDLAEQYYRENPSLTIFEGESHQLLWSYDPGAGLILTAIETPVYHEAMAMRLSETALREDAGTARAVPLWLASNFRREIQSPKDEGFVNPVYGKDRRDAMYYAVAAGAGPTQQVLGRGIDGNDTPLVRKALSALDQTAGGTTLWTGTGDRKPLLEALRYPSRRVQYEAALALGGAGPRQAFDGSDQVVRILGSAIRDASAKYAVVVTSDAERNASISDVLRNQGYSVLPPARSLADAQQGISEAPGIDLIVSQLPSAQTAELIEQAHTTVKLKATPILALVSTQGYAEQAARYIRDPRVRMLREGAAGAEVGEASKQLVEQATGGAITMEEAEGYKERSLSVLRDLAVSGNTVLNVADAGGPLVTALSEAKDQNKVRISEVLAHVNSRIAQQAVTDAALAAKGEEMVVLLQSAAGSAKRFGNMLEARHITAIKEVATTGAPAEATAAAALMGSLNLPNAEIVPLILGAAGGAEAERALR